ncbi:MAG TPA: OsmC family protein [Candidatus Limnocylindrales bacterium]|nr:OsmC family protein [Candidatus Limnocylindrales bacterium]
MSGGAGVRTHLVRKARGQPVYLLDVSAGPGRRTTVRGPLWDGVLNATPDDDTDGPSPIEAYLAAVAACFVRNLRSVADSAHITFEGVELHLAADRSDDQPAVTTVRLEAELTTEAAIATATRVVGLALRYGTISRTVARASRFEPRISVNGTPVEVPDVR